MTDASTRIKAVLDSIKDDAQAKGLFAYAFNYGGLTEVLAHIDAQAADIAALRVDAERYRYLKQFSRAASLYIDGNHCWTLRPPHRLHVFLKPTFDEAVDEAMKEQQP